MSTPNTRGIEACLPTEEDLQKVGDHYWGGDYEPQYQELIHLKQSFKEILTPKIEKYFHQELQKVREELIQEIYDEFNWLNTNNAIPDSEIGKGDLHWEMLQKISSDTRRELQARLIKVATEHNVTLNAYHHQSELDQDNK